LIEDLGGGAQWNIDGGEYSMMPSGSAPSFFIYADNSALYSTSKIVYLSPVIDGFSAAVGFEPSSNGLKEGTGDCTEASSVCSALSSSPVASDIGKKRRDTIGAALQYFVDADGFATKASVGILHGSPVNYDGAPATSGALVHGYDVLNVDQAGVQTSFDGLTVGANIKTGQVLDGYAFEPRGTRNGLTYMVGASYAFGPYVLGASYFNGQTAGAYTPGAHMARTLSEVGGNYVVGKDLSLFVQHEYGHRHQPGNTAIGNGSGTGNAQVQALVTGATFKW
jgi:hypothetical protein